MKKALSKLVEILRRLLGLVVAIPLYATLFVVSVLLMCFSIIDLPFEWIITGDCDAFMSIMIFVEEDLWKYGSKAFNKIIGK